jgi:arsenite/tail-anchored protein-transporting ATPase
MTGPDGAFPPLPWDRWSSPFVVFTGKGGVGKTTVAAATAVALADAGHSVLTISTDPASNLSDVFATAAGDTPTPVTGAAGLHIMDLDPQVAATSYRQRVMAGLGAGLSEDERRAADDALAGACTVEVAAFEAFARTLTDPTMAGRYDHVLFDTAPTGHTLRLLSLPAAWAGYLAAHPEATRALGPLTGISGQRSTFEHAVHALRDPDVTTMVVVAQPDTASLHEAARTLDELDALGMPARHLVINGVLTRPLPGDATARAYAGRQHAALARLPQALRSLDVSQVPLVAIDLVGLDALRTVTAPIQPGAEPAPNYATTTTTERRVDLPELPGVDDLVEDLAAIPRGVVVVTGKGGVGKTTIAARLAAGLARLGHPVHLSTTDPAAGSFDAFVGDKPPTLTIDRIDPAVEAERYAREHPTPDNDQPETQTEAPGGPASPCTQELAVFLAFARTIRLGRDRLVVLDTAASGHTLLLLDVTGAFHRQTLATVDVAGTVTTPLMRLQDPRFTRLILVTLPATTPVNEASDLQDELRNAGIDPYGWVINACLSATGTADPVLAHRAQLEHPHITRVTHHLTARTWITPWNPTTSGPRAHTTV